MKLRALVLALLALLVRRAGLGAEQINLFDVAIEVERDGDIVVTETINVTAEGDQIRRGIFRDLPRFYESDGARLPTSTTSSAYERDGRANRYDTDTEGNAYRIRIGDEDVFLEHGAHTYVIRYRVKNQVRYFDDYDEIYWNATGNYWAFPIVRAAPPSYLPPGARVTATHGYTGADGASRRCVSPTRKRAIATSSKRRAARSRRRAHRRCRLRERPDRSAIGRRPRRALVAAQRRARDPCRLARAVFLVSLSRLRARRPRSAQGSGVSAL